MSNPIARLLGQAEINLADVSRRAAASVAAPIKAKGQEVVADVMGAATSAIKGIVIKAVLGLIAGIMLIVAIIYAVDALFWFLLPSLGPSGARLFIGGVFLGLAVIAVLAMVFWPKGGPPPARTLRPDVEQAKVGAQAKVEAQRAMAETRSEAASARASVADAPAMSDLKSGVETLASILGDAGYRREQAGLKTGLALAGQLKPMQIVSLALIGGYVAGLRYTARRR